MRAPRSRSVGPWLLAAIILGAAPAVAGGPGEQHPLEPADLSSPRTALRGFRDRADAVFAEVRTAEKSIAKATRTRRMIAAVVGCLDLREVAPSLAESQGRQAAVCLKEVFDRIELPADADVPDAAAVERETLKRWRVPHTEITLVRVADGPREGEWLFSADTVQRAEEFFRLVRDLPYRADAGSPGFHDLYVRASGWMIPDAWVLALPAWARAEVFGESVWRWLAAIGLLAVGVGCVGLVYRLARRATAAHAHRLASHVLACAAPASLIAAAFAIDYLLTYQVRLTGDLLLATKATLRVVAIVGGILLVLCLLRQLADLVIHSRGLRPGTIDTQLVRLGFKILTLLAVAWMVIVGASYLGLSVAPLLAGLGVGGLAVALAAQHTIENVIAGLVLFADKPVRIGDAGPLPGPHADLDPQLRVREAAADELHSPRPDPAPDGAHAAVRDHGRPAPLPARDAAADAGDASADRRRLGPRAVHGLRRVGAQRRGLRARRHRRSGRVSRDPGRRVAAGHGRGARGGLRLRLPVADAIPRGRIGDRRRPQSARGGGRAGVARARRPAGRRLPRRSAASRGAGAAAPCRAARHRSGVAAA
jgi:hypothetical protein